MKAHFFTQPSPRIGKVLERYSTIDADKEYTVLSQESLKIRKILLPIVTLFIAATLSAFIYHIYRNSDAFVLSFILYPFALAFGFIGGIYLVYPEKNFLNGANYFFGERGGHFVEVSKNYDNRTEHLYLYDEIADMDTYFTVVKVQNEGANETKYYPKELKAKVVIRFQNGKTERHNFTYPLKHDGKKYDIDESHDSGFYRFLEKLEQNWRLRHPQKEPKEQLLIEDVTPTVKPTPDPVYEIEEKDFFIIFPLSLLIIVIIYYICYTEPDNFLPFLWMTGIVGGYLGSLFAAFKPMRLLQWALVMDVLWAFVLTMWKIFISPH